jgi:hypothetical protein
LLDQFADSPIEALHHAIGLRMAWGRQAMHDTHLGTADIERVFARGLFALGCKTVGKLTGVVSQNLLNFHRCDFSQPAQKIGTADVSLVFLNAQIDPSRRSINSHKEVAPLRLIRHLRQVLDVNV